jgi:hypothetical protein
MYKASSTSAETKVELRCSLLVSHVAWLFATKVKKRTKRKPKPPKKQSAKGDAKCAATTTPRARKGSRKTERDIAEGKQATLGGFFLLEQAPPPLPARDGDGGARAKTRAPVSESAASVVTVVSSSASASSDRDAGDTGTDTDPGTDGSNSDGTVCDLTATPPQSQPRPREQLERMPTEALRRKMRSYALKSVGLDRERMVEKLAQIAEALERQREEKQRKAAAWRAAAESPEPALVQPRRQTELAPAVDAADEGLHAAVPVGPTAASSGSDGGRRKGKRSITPLLYPFSSQPLTAVSAAPSASPPPTANEETPSPTSTPVKIVPKRARQRPAAARKGAATTNSRTVGSSRGGADSLGGGGGTPAVRTPTRARRIDAFFKKAESGTENPAAGPARSAFVSPTLFETERVAGITSPQRGTVPPTAATHIPLRLKAAVPSPLPVATSMPSKPTSFLMMNGSFVDVSSDSSSGDEDLPAAGCWRATAPT